MKKIEWNENGWTSVQDADAEKHILEVSCLCENGKVVQIRIRHNDGEEKTAVVTCEGKEILPISCVEFEKLFAKKKIELK